MKSQRQFKINLKNKKLKLKIKRFQSTNWNHLKVKLRMHRLWALFKIHKNGKNWWIKKISKNPKWKFSINLKTKFTKINYLNKIKSNNNKKKKKLKSNKRKLFLKDKRKSILMNCLDPISHRVQKVEKIAWIKVVISLKKAAVKSKLVLINRRWMKNLWKRLSLNKKNKIRSCKKWNKKNRICCGKKRGSSRRDNRNKMRG